MMKKLIAAVAAICLLISGCGVISENNEQGRYIPTSKLDVANMGYTGRLEKIAVYFLNKTSGTLTAEVRTVVIEQDTNPAKVAVEELLEGPTDSELLLGVAPLNGISLDRIEYSRDVANVYLLYNGAAMQPMQKYILELAVANTVTDILGATYICIFYNGIQTGFSGIPYAPLKKQTGSIDDSWIQTSAKYLEIPAVPGEAPAGETQTEPTATPGQLISGQTPVIQAPKVNTITTVLYFISADGGYILPEVRDVKYTGTNYIQSLISEMGKGPQNASVMVSPLANGLELTRDPEIAPAGDGAYNLTLDFNKQPTKYDLSDMQNTLLSYAAILNTITGFVPGIESVEIRVNGKLLSLDETEPAAAVQRGDYLGYIGSSAPIYFADKTSDLLLPVSRSMEQGKIWSAKARLQELIKGPLPGDGGNAWSVIPPDITNEDIISVDVYADTACVNLSKRFKDSCSGLSSKDEMLLIYAMVDTITAMDGISKVQFLVEGQQTDTLAGYLCLSDPFLRNYGIIKQSS